MKIIFSFFIILLMLACTNNSNAGSQLLVGQSTEQQHTDNTPLSIEEKQNTTKLTFADVAGTYDNFENGEIFSRLVLNNDGTAEWVILGSLTYTEYTYTISYNTITFCFVDDHLAGDCFDYLYDANKHAISDGDGTVYYLQNYE